MLLDHEMDNGYDAKYLLFLTKLEITRNQKILETIAGARQTDKLF